MAEKLTQSATYDSRRNGLSRLLRLRPEQRSGGRYYELNGSAGDPFKDATQNLEAFVGGDWIPNTSNYRMVRMRHLMGVAALFGYHAFINFKEGRITEEQYNEKKKAAERRVKRNAQARHLHPKMEVSTRLGTTTFRSRSARIILTGDFSQRTLDLASLLAGLDPAIARQPKQPIQEPTFGEENYSFMGRESLYGGTQNSDANRLFGEYVQQAKDALQGDTTDPQLVHAKATLAAIHRFGSDLVHYKRARRSLVVINAMINAGEKKRK